MRVFLTVLLILFASYADIFLYRRGIIPVSPAYFLIPLFFALFFVYNNLLNFLALTRSHTFKFYLALAVLSIVYAIISPANSEIILISIVLYVIGLLLYIFATHHFRTSSRYILGFFLVLAFLTLSGSLWYDTFVGLPLPTKLVLGNIRKGGFGENPNVTASGIKFISLALLFFFRKKVFWRYFFLIITIASVFLTFSRSGVVSVLVIVFALILNNWEATFNITAKSFFTKGIKILLFLSIVYAALYFSMDVLKSQIPEFAEGDIAKRIDQLLGKSDAAILNQDDNSQFGRNSLRKRFTEYVLDNPFGYGTGYASDKTINPVNSHNYYLFIATEYGLLGLVTLLFFIYRCFRLAIRHNQFYYFVLATLLFLEGFISHGMFEERALILTIAFFDSYLYPFEKDMSKKSVTDNIPSDIANQTELT